MDAARKSRRRNRSARLRVSLLVVLSCVAISSSVRGQNAEDERTSAVEASAPTQHDDTLALQAQQILRARCSECHGADKARAELRLDDRGSALVGGDSGLPAIVPGKPELSELIARVTTADLLDRMPPEERAPLTAEQQQLLERWILAGASWPDESAQHWAFVAPRASSPPEVHRADWPRDPLDAYVLARLEAAGLEPSPEADASTLARRLSLDLVGLPPAPDDVDALRADPDFYDTYVDRLLASPAFAERWSRHWLDKAGYADSDGYENDKARPEAWRWRDWVLNSLQRDQPYDRFLHEQIAGDLLPDADDDTRIATAFFRQTLTNTEAGIDEEEFRLEAVMQRVDLTGTALLGLTVNCARCHDHKYDPISAADYYSLAAFFDNSDETQLELPAEAAALAEFKQALVGQQREFERLSDEFKRAYERFLPTLPRVHPLSVEGADAQGMLTRAPDAGARVSLRVTDRPERVDGFAVELFDAPVAVELRGLRARVGDRELAMRALPRSVDPITGTLYRNASWRLEEPISATDAGALTLELQVDGPLSRFRVSSFSGSSLDTQLPARIRRVLATPIAGRTNAQVSALAVYDSQHDAELLTALKALNQHRRDAPKNPAPRVPVLSERRAERRTTMLLERGDFLRGVAAVQPDTPAVLPSLAAAGERATRLDLARWLTAPEHPLTARVFVNDVWQHLFGAGLVRTPGDFGTRGEPPTHPELLDQLAVDARAAGWSRKALIRRLVRSATYRQASTHREAAELADPENRLLHRQSRSRVDAEVVRDQALAVAGLLSSKFGGPSVFPPLPDGVTDQSYANLFQWKTSAGEDRHRRGLYTFFKRTAPHPHLEQFDAPPSLTSCVRRGRSNTPLQALITLNDPVFVEAAGGLARRLLQTARDEAELLTQAFRLCLARTPSPDERAELLELLTAARAWYAEHPSDAELLVGAPDGEHAAWTATLRVLLNLDEFLVRP